MKNFNSRIDLDKLETASSKIKSVAHPVRLAIIDLLRDKALAVNEIQAELKIEQAAASYHLINMKNSGVLVSTKEANKVIYSLVDKQFIDLLDHLK